MPLRALLPVMFFTVLAFPAVPLCRGSGVDEPPTAKLRVETTIFPLFDWLRRIGGDRVEVNSMLPPGADPHHFSPRPSDVRRLATANLFVYLDHDLEPWAGKLVAALPSADRPRIVAAGAAIERHGTRAHDQCGDTGCRHAAGGDPHIWLDPLLAVTLVDVLEQSLVELDPGGGRQYQARADALRREIRKLDREIVETLAGRRHDTIFYVGHFAFGYFARRYGLRHLSPFGGYAPGTTAAPGGMAEMIRQVKASGQDTLFYDPLEDDRLARMVAAETGLELAPLYSLHGLTREQRRGGEQNYLSIMRRNLETLRRGLGAP